MPFRRRRGAIDVESRPVLPEFDYPDPPADPKRRIGGPGGIGSAPTAAKAPGEVKLRAKRRKLRREAGTAKVIESLLTGGTPEVEPRTDAGWFTPGTESYMGGGRPAAKWWFLPRSARLLTTWASFGTVGATGWAWWQWPDTTPVVLTWTTAGSLAAFGWRHDRRLLALRHWYRYVWPAHVALRHKLGYPTRTPARRYLDIPVGFDRHGGRIKVWLPYGWTGDKNERAAIVASLREVLPLTQIEVVWHTTGREHHLEIRSTRKRLPTMIPYSTQLQQLFDGAGVDTKVLAIDGNGNPVGWNRATDSPHGLFNAESGAGKSTLLSLYGAQCLRDGEILCVVDPKQFSLEFAVLLEDTHPNLHYWRQPGEVHNGLAWVVEQYTARNAAALRALKQRKPVPKFQPIVVLIDESNITFRAVKKWWRQVREPQDPPTPPAIDDVLTLLQGGRQVRIHVLLVTQHGTAKGLGDTTGELREGLGTRILARSDRKAWGLCAPSIESPPAKSDIRGRVWVVEGDRATEAQVPYLNTDQLVELATTPRPGEGEVFATPDDVTAAGKVGPPHHGGAVTAADDDQAVTGTLIPLRDNNDTEAEDAEVLDEDRPLPLVALYDASQDKGAGLINKPLSAIKQARTRARRRGEGWFPAPTAMDGQTELYDLADLEAWARGEHPDIANHPNQQDDEDNEEGAEV